MSKEFYLQWHITNLCNLRCLHCYQDDFSNKADLNLQDLKKVADNFLSILSKWKKLAVINLTGGEPFLKKELFGLLEYLNSHKQVKKLGIITNATCFNKDNLSKLKEFKKIKEIKLSLEATDEELNDSIRGKGTFVKILKAIELLKQQNKFEITLMFTLFKKNLSEVSKLFNFVESKAVDGVIFERFIPLGKGRALKQELLSKEEWHKFLLSLLQFLEIPFEKQFFSYKAFWVRFKNGKPSLFGAPCVVADSGICIMPNGDCYPCRRFNLKIGNLLQEPFDKIYKSSKVLKDLRKRNNLKGKCRTCLIKTCRGCRALAFALTSDYLAEDLQCDYNGD
ncbi:MAG: radical SAM protein [Candidatus Omnitrophota bacterium]|nr:radical SAM protein [Candidatus Omnitrophota bacterium]